ncbi:stage II sporulation protein P [Vermiculatibacterium agrestimuris]|uniref:stage II sporulation protein P n=1 Tax=Vermiculatibacterium agrestimuris TaxID=2941519 RepID=UPI002040988F|nr:stage II sporulation protein P [Vermiculatibacterium agrestimuris]
MRRIHWGRLLRRSLSLCMAVLALWLLLLGVGAGAAERSLEALGQNEDFVTAALRLELGPAGQESLPFWQRLAVGQSSLLEANPPKHSETPEPLESAPLPNAQPAPDHDDMTEEPPPAASEPGDVVERTLIPTTTQGYVTGAGLYLYNRTDLSVDLAAVAQADLCFSLAPAEAGPQILIIHSHATEAYTPQGEDTYVPSDNNTRTTDERYNMLRVGDEMERVFTEMGLSVLHDRELYDYPQYNGSYTRSGPAVEAYLAQYPTIKLVLDVHRDALVGSDGTVYKAVTAIDGAKTAQVMLVVGSDAGGTEHPHWQENLALAAKLQKGLDTLYPTLARPMTLRQSAYNQNLLPGSLLVEVGSHGNSLQEALAGARAFARAAGAVFLGLVRESVG